MNPDGTEYICTYVHGSYGSSKGNSPVHSLLKPQSRFCKNYFVNWASSGRWFEADITEKPNGLYNVTVYDGDTGDYNGTEISKLGIKSEDGDVVLAYSTSGNPDYKRYAAKGIHNKTDGRNIYVKFDDGRKRWEDINFVHKLVTLYSHYVPTARFRKQYFVHYDNSVTGGRWFECDINKQPNGNYDITDHEGDKGKGSYSSSEISKLGVKSTEGDIVISYRTSTDKRYGFKGTHVATNGSTVYVKYSDGVAYWENAIDVHKVVTLYSLVSEQSCKFCYKVCISQY